MILKTKARSKIKTYKLGAHFVVIYKQKKYVQGILFQKGLKLCC